MSKRRSDTRPLRQADTVGGTRFLPLRLVQLDLETGELRGDVVRDERRAWVEAISHGTVVGRVELFHGLAELDVADVAAKAAAGAGRPHLRSVPDDQLATASVVVSTICANPGQLARTVRSLLELDYPSFDVVVVDNRRDGAASEPLPELPNDPRVSIIREARPGVSSGRNRGVEQSKGEIVAFTDDDASVDRSWLRAIGARFATEPAVDAIGGLVLPRELETPPQLWFEEFYGGFSTSFEPSVASLATDDDDALFPYAARRFGAGCNMAFRRTALERIGGFDVALGVGTPARGGEDLAIFIELVSAGGVVAFEPAALVRHSHRRSERAFLRQVLSYGIGLTAMYTALIAHDRRHATAMLRRLPGGLRLLLRPRTDRSVSHAPSYPRRVLLYQLVGMAYGPVAYARSRRWARRAA